MSKNDSKPTRGASQGYRGQANKTLSFRNVQKVTRSLNSDEDVPMLKFGPNNNFVMFTESLSTACLEKYGALGKLIKLEKYWEPPEVKKEDFMEKDESGKLIVNELKKTAMIQA